MRICYLTDNLDVKFGNGKFSLKIIELTKENIPDLEAVVLTIKPSGAENKKVLLDKPLFNFLKIRSIVKTCDLVHALDGFPFGVIAGLCTFGTNVKFIITAVGSSAIQPFNHPLHSWLLKWAYKKAAKVIAVSNYTAREIKKEIPELDIKVINHGVDFNDYQIPQGEVAPSEIISKEPYILSVGMVKKRKGYHISLKAFAKVQKQVPELNYIIVGLPLDKAYFGELKKLVKDLKIEGKVFFYDFVEHKFLRQLYHHAELFCLLPQDIKKDVEGFGLVFLEAAACGLPVVVGKGSGADDAMLPNENGFLLAPQDIDGISEAILKILQNKDLKHRFSRASVDFVKKMNWETVGKQYTQFFYFFFLITKFNLGKSDLLQEVGLPKIIK